MKTIELWIWTHTEPLTKKRIKTRYLLSEADALDRFVDPVRIEHTREVRQVPAGPHEWHMTGGFRNAPRSQTPAPGGKKPTDPEG